MDRHTTDFVTRHRENDYTQLSDYSPQDSPTQAPTRQEAAIHPRQHQRMGSVDGEPTTGGHSIADIIERRWNKGKHRVPSNAPSSEQPHFLTKPSIEPESRRESFVQRIEAAGHNVLRRSSSSADALIDKLADTLNNWSTGYEEPKQEQKQETKHQEEAKGELQRQNQDSRSSWSLSFLFPSEKERRASWSQRAYSLFFRNNNNHQEWLTQPDVEVQGSDEAYDDVQGSFRVMRAITPKQTSIQKRRPSYAAVAKRSLSDHQAAMFDANPESGRVKVPPLSNTQITEPRKRPVSQLLYDTKPAPPAPTIHNQYHVVYHKKHFKEDHEIPDHEPRFDSDFENWAPQPERNTARKSSSMA